MHIPVLQASRSTSISITISHNVSFSLCGAGLLSDFSDAIDGATYIGEQNVGGSSVTNRIAIRQVSILRSVYQNEEMSEWHSHTTPRHVSTHHVWTLNGVPPCFLLGQIESPTLEWPVPGLHDLGCASIPSALHHSDYDNVDDSDER